MNKAKKFFAIIMSVFMLTLTYVGCPNVDNGTDDDSTTGSSGTQQPNPGPGPGPGPGPSGKIASLQAQIDSTPAGGTVDLSLAADDTTETITITKPITVNAAKVGKGLKVEVAHNISSNVGLKGFQSGSSLKIASSTLATVGRGVQESKGNTFENYGDGALPLFLDGCDFTKFESESDVAVYFEGKKSEIDELMITKGTDRKDFEENPIDDPVRFTFIDMGEDKKAEDMSHIGKMFVDEGVCDVNLIGGKFDEVEFDPAFFDPEATDEMRFKFDGEFDQFANADFYFGEGENAETHKYESKDFWEGEFWGDRFDVKDITVAEKEIVSGSGIYKYTMTKEAFDYLDGFVTIVFLAPDQAAVIEAGGVPTYDYTAMASGGGVGINYSGRFVDDMAVITPDHPVYSMSLMGHFAADGTSAGVHAIHGAENHYVATECKGNFWAYRQVYLDEYMNYSSDAVVVEIGDTDVTYYVNTAAIRKSDLVIGAWPDYTNEQEMNGMSGSGSKLSVVDLSNYIPYFVVDRKKLEAIKCEMVFDGKEYGFPQSAEDYGSEAWQAQIVTNIENGVAMENKLAELGFYNSANGFIGQFTFPYDEAARFDYGLAEYRICNMSSVDTSVDTYPSEITVVTTDVEYPNNMLVDVYYWNGTSFPTTPEKVVIGTIDPWLGEWYYYINSSCDPETQYTVDDAWRDCSSLCTGLTDKHGFQGKVWAKPKEKITAYKIPLNGLLDNFGMPVGQVWFPDGENNIPISGYSPSRRNLIGLVEPVYTDISEIETQFGMNGYKWFKKYENGIFSDPVDWSNLDGVTALYGIIPYIKMTIVAGDTTIDGGVLLSANLDQITSFNTNYSWYKTASLSGEKWTIAQLKNNIGAEVFLKQDVQVYNVNNEAVGEPMSYAEFMTKIKNGENYYSDPNSKSSKISYIYAVGSNSPIKVYNGLTEEAQNDFSYNVMYENVSYTSLINLLEVLDQIGNGYLFYADQDKTVPLTTEDDLKALPYNAIIYAVPPAWLSYVYTYLSTDDGDCVVPYAELKDILMLGGRYNTAGLLVNLTLYSDPGLTTPITEENMNELSNGAIIYDQSYDINDWLTVINENGYSNSIRKAVIKKTLALPSTDGMPEGVISYTVSVNNYAKYEYFADESMTIPLSTEEIDNCTGSIYSKQVLNIIATGDGKFVTMTRAAIEGYLAASKHFYRNKDSETGEYSGQLYTYYFVNGYPWNVVYMQEGL